MSAHIKSGVQSQAIPKYTCQSTPTKDLSFHVLSGCLKQMADDCREPYRLDTESAKKIQEQLCEELKKAKAQAYVLGESGIRAAVWCESKEILLKNCGHIRKTLVEVCVAPYRQTGEIEEYMDGAYVIFEKTSALKISFSGKKKSSLGESAFCGDSFGFLESAADGKIAAYISDGMGSGALAERSSGICSLYLQKILTHMMRTDGLVTDTLEALNGFLCSKNNADGIECSSTLDLGVFDLKSAKATFYKSGAAPTYVFRDRGVFQLRSHTLPMGIVAKADIGRLELELLAGDIIIMVSDGVTEGREHCPELFDYLKSRLLTHSAEELASAVMDYAKQRSSSDDISVIAVRIEEKGISELAA